MMNELFDDEGDRNQHEANDGHHPRGRRLQRLLLRQRHFSGYEEIIYARCNRIEKTGNLE